MCEFLNMRRLKPIGGSAAAYKSMNFSVRVIVNFCAESMESEMCVDEYVNHISHVFTVWIRF